jgi:hypothetical protein
MSRADHSSRGILPIMVCVTECDREALILRRPWSTRGCCPMDKTTKYNFDKLGHLLYPFRPTLNNVFYKCCNV